MCWFTLTPIKKHEELTSTTSSCAEQIVRVHPNSSPRYSDVKVKLPNGFAVELDHDSYQHHLYPHLHTMHLDGFHNHHHHVNAPIVKLRGPGRKRCPLPSPPPPSRDSSRCRPPFRTRPGSPDRSREPIYRTQIVEPIHVRERTRALLRTVQPERPRGRLRRVAGYEALDREVPWSWDCVSSTVGSAASGNGKRFRRREGGAGLRYPPYGPMDRWL